VTVRIDEMTHMPATTEPSGSGAPSTGAAAAKPLTPPQILALVRREIERRERLGVD
jgi:hypothetical protein